MAPSLAHDPIALARENWRERGWADAADGMALVTSIMRIQQELLSTIDAELRSFNLTFARYEVLMLLEFTRRGRLPLGKIGERLQVHPASVTNVVQRLTDDGLVHRIPNPDDGRSTLAGITAEGSRTALAATELLNHRVFSSLPLDSSDQVDIYETFATVRHAFGDFT
ncbi:MAG TPA: MarR family transcriptional regulator [Ilumatobacteraceae bacterium]|nr:MarR family transcriptional regulator [Ilumatobacteraceae bacterium]